MLYLGDFHHLDGHISESCDGKPAVSFVGHQYW